jgi:DDE superfamily endonuclease/Helix-turn-helix of DDE superfamily endonuclease
LSRQTLAYVAGVIRRHREQIGSCWRKLTPGRQALLVLAYLRKGETFAELAAGFGIGTATAWRYVTETVALLAALSPKLRGALRKAKQAGHAYVVIDGTLIPIDRVAVDRPFYSGKHHRHGMNLQVIATPDGDIVWVSGPLPGAVHDLTAARIWGILRELAACGLVVLADKGYHGAGEPLITPYKGRNKPASQKAANRAHTGPVIPSTRQITRWQLTHPDRLDDDERAQLADIQGRCPHLTVLARHVRSFAEIMAHRTSNQHLDHWLAAAEADDQPELRSFANGLRRDLQAVTAGLTLPWSSGPVEGNVTRIKMIKRQTYGRASYALSRKRVILRPG